MYTNRSRADENACWRRSDNTDSAGGYNRLGRKTAGKLLEEAGSHKPGGWRAQQDESVGKTIPARGAARNPGPLSNNAWSAGPPRVNESAKVRCDPVPALPLCKPKLYAAHNGKLYARDQTATVRAMLPALYGKPMTPDDFAELWASGRPMKRRPYARQWADDVESGLLFPF